MRNPYYSRFNSIVDAGELNTANIGQYFKGFVGAADGLFQQAH